MYSDLWSPGLRQGDIAGPLPLPLLGTKFEVIAQAQSLTEGVAASARGKIIIEAEDVFVAVVSHDCEFNEDKRNKFLVARLRRIPGNLNDDQVEALWASNDVEGRVAADEPVAAVDSFALEPIAGAFEQPQIINFATITPLPIAMKDDLASAKQAELTQEFRVLLRKKLAWFFGREAEDVAEEEKRPRPTPDEAQDTNA